MFSMIDAEFACIIYDGESRSILQPRDQLEFVHYFMDMIKMV